MTRWQVAMLNAALIALLVGLLSVPAWAQTVTPAPSSAATPSSQPSPRREQLRETLGKHHVMGVTHFDDGIAVGVAADAPSTISLLKRVRCIFNPPALIAGQSVDFTCTVAGAVANDMVIAVAENVGTNLPFAIQSATAGTGLVTVRLIGTGTVDAGATTFRVFVIR